jgi:hypothetical protein
MSTQHQLEAIFDLLLSDIVDDRERYLDPDGERWHEVGTSRGGDATPWNEQRHAEAVAQSRWLADENAFAANGLENRVNYVIGTGHQYLLGPRRGAETSAELLDQVDQFLSDFRRVNHWYTRQIESLRRYDRDGEALVRLFADPDGMTHLRFIEPGEIRSPPGDNENIHCGIEYFPGDAEQPTWYHTESEKIAADEVQHRKANADLCQPRGIPLYYPVRRNLRRAALIQRNMSTIVEVQSAIALIRKHTGTGIDNLQSMRTATADVTVSDSATGRTDYYKQYPPGTIIDAPKGVEYEFPTAGVSAAGIVDVLKAELRAIAARLVMPEFMFTSDASNAAYASTMVAEAPAVKMFERLQQTLIHDDLELHYRAIEHAIETRQLPPEALYVQITAEAPNVQVRDFLKQSHADKIAHAAGVLSPQTWSQKLGLDYNREQRNIEKAPPTALPQPPSALRPHPLARPPADHTHGSRFPTDDDPNPTA